MNIFLAGATGAVGRSLIPLLTEPRPHRHRHHPHRERRPTRCAALGAEPVVRRRPRPRRRRAPPSRAARPDAIVHQMTALGGDIDLRQLRRARSRTPTACAPRAPTTCSPRPARAGVERFVAQSFAGWPYARSGGPVKAEDDPLDPDPPAQLRTTLDGDPHARGRRSRAPAASRCATAASTGPAPGSRPAATSGRWCARASFPLVGDGGGVWSFCHIEDAAAATLAALEHGTPGEIYNVCDDEPGAGARVAARARRARSARRRRGRCPRWLARLAGEHAASR